MKMKRKDLRKRRQLRGRKKVLGTGERPRIAVFRSLKGIYAQAIDDVNGVTLVSASTVEKEFKGAGKSGGNVEAAKLIGDALGKRLLEKGIESAVFDRAGFLYHGRIKALADAVREAGVKI